MHDQQFKEIRTTLANHDQRFTDLECDMEIVIDILKKHDQNFQSLHEDIVEIRNEAKDTRLELRTGMSQMSDRLYRYEN